MANEQELISYKGKQEAVSEAEIVNGYIQGHHDWRSVLLSVARRGGRSEGLDHIRPDKQVNRICSLHFVLKMVETQRGT